MLEAVQESERADIAQIAVFCEDLKAAVRCETLRELDHLGTCRQMVKAKKPQLKALQTKVWHAIRRNEMSKLLA